VFLGVIRSHQIVQLETIHFGYLKCMEPLNSKASCRPVPVAPRLARSPAAAGHSASAAKALAEAAGAPGKGRVWQREIQRFSWDVDWN
jgi:hypothetical protein